MRLASIDSMTKRLDAAFLRASDSKLPEDVRSDLARHLCVLASGYIEESVRLLLESYTSGKSDVRVANYVTSHLARVTNLKKTKLGDLLAAFDQSWRDSFELNTTDEERDAIDSVVANRHQIAHGKNTGLSLAVMKDYWKAVKNTVDILEVKVIK